MFYRGMYAETTLEGLNNVVLNTQKILEIVEVPPNNNQSKRIETMGEKIKRQADSLIEQKTKGEQNGKI